jgi:predicted peroxiredoxin
MSEKLVIVCTAGPDDPEKATIAFVMATAAQASDMEVVMAFQGNGVALMKKGVVETVYAENFPPLAELVEVFMEMEGTAFVCGPCAKTREVNDSTMIDGAQIANAGAQIAEIASATNVLCY